MGIHLVERSFELHGPSGLGAAPRPDLVGPALSKLQGTLIDSVRMGFLHSSHARGKIPQVLRAAAEVRFVGMEGTGDESTILAVAEKFGARYLILEEAGTFDSIQDLYDQPESSPSFEYLGEVDGARLYRIELAR